MDLGVCFGTASDDAQGLLPFDDAMGHMLRDHVVLGIKLKSIYLCDSSVCALQGVSLTKIFSIKYDV